MITITPEPVRSRHQLLLARDKLERIASAQAHDDADNGIDIEVGVPTPGMSGVIGAVRTERRELQDVQRDELRLTKERLRSATEAKRLLDEWTTFDEAPPFAPERSMLPVRLLQGLGLSAIGIEALLLHDRINEVLQSGTGYTVEGLGGALFIAGTAAVAAHVRGEATAKADATHDPDERDAENAKANMAALTIVLAGAAAVFARLYAASISGDGIDGSGLAFFAMLTALIFMTAFVFPGAIRARRRAINESRVEDAKDVASKERDEAQDLIDLMATAHPEQLSELDAAGVEALEHYLRELANSHIDSYSGDLVRGYLARAHRDGSLSRLITEERPADSRGDDPGETTGEPGGGHGGGPGGGGPTGGFGGSGVPGDPGEPPPNGGGYTYASPEDLLDDIFGRRAS